MIKGHRFRKMDFVKAGREYPSISGQKAKDMDKSANAI